MSETARGISLDDDGLPPPPSTTSIREAFASDAPLPTDNSSAEIYSKDAGSAADSAGRTSDENVPKPKGSNEGGFKVSGDYTSSSSFQGKKTGYVFRKGSKGLGYYKDKAMLAAASKKANPGAAETASASNSSYDGNDKFEYRQSEKSVTILIQVPGIDAGTVSADFKPRSIKVTFKTASKKLHSFSLDNLFEEIDPEESRFDVATNNMIVILGKKKQGMVWGTLVGVPDMKNGGGLRDAGEGPGHADSGSSNSGSSSSSSSSISSKKNKQENNGKKGRKNGGGNKKEKDVKEKQVVPNTALSKETDAILYQLD